MSGTNDNPRIGPNGCPVRPFVLPRTLPGRLKVWRLMIYRRLVQAGVLLLFFGSAHWHWQLFGAPVLSGNLSASTLLGFIPLADPFAVLQIWLAGSGISQQVVLGAGIVLLGYLLLGGRTWCSWVCPINPITDLAGWLRRRLNIKDLFQLRRNLRYTVLALTLVLSVVTGVAAFEWVSPISMAHRELLFGLGLGWTALLGIFVFDLLVLRNGWCGHLCPLGAFYALVGKLAPLRVRFDAPTCTHCVECIRVCPEPRVLDLKQAAREGLIRSGECSNCGRCLHVCPEHTLSFDLRPLIARHNRTAEARRHSTNNHTKH